jgi:sugar phosphate isomerase/epimerase
MTDTSARSTCAERQGRLPVLASTNAHKQEPLEPLLEVFARLGLMDIDLNLRQLVEDGLPESRVAFVAASHGVRIRALSGGWCDFYDRRPEIERTFESVARQVAIGRALGVHHLRLFFGRLRFEDYSPAVLETIAGNLLHLSDTVPDVSFVLENHDGASLHPEVCREILDRVARPNVRLNFDPINFAKAGVDPMRALEVVRPHVAHVHLKGLERGDYCEFGEGDVELVPVLRSLVSGGYRGGFTVEYEGRHDGTVRLFRSVERARAVLRNL